MKVCALAAPPQSGSVAEHRFEEPDGDTWFRFELDDGREWAGLFCDARLLPEKAVVEFGDDRTVLINVGGAGYVLDVPNAVLLYKPDIAPLVQAMPVPERQIVIARDFTGLYALGQQGEIWRSGRLASDGVELRHTTSNALHGRVWRNEGWHNFSLAYDSWEYSLGERLPKRGNG